METRVAEHPNAALFRRGYEAFNKGDLATVRELFDPNIVWHIGGNNRFTGDKIGVDATLAFFGELVAASQGTFRLEVHDILANDDHAIALVNSHLEAGGKAIDDKGAHVVHIRNGKTVESWFFDWDTSEFDKAFPR